MRKKMKKTEPWSGQACLWRACVVALLMLPHMAGAREKEQEPVEILPKQVEKFIVKTRSKLNREIPFYLRVPKNYQQGKAHRLLYLCPYFNEEGLALIERSGEWFKIADERGCFVLTATFKQDSSQVRDRKLSYYYPESFSGDAVIEALDRVEKKYHVDTERLLMQGISGGAQFIHRFALWAPERVTAVALNSSSWFDPANETSDRVAWLITVGDSDPAYPASTEMTESLRQMGATPVFCSFIGADHGASMVAKKLSYEFIKFYDEWDQEELGKKRDEKKKALKAEEMPFIGDLLSGIYFPNTPEQQERIAPDSQIFLPSKQVAQEWGKFVED